MEKNEFERLVKESEATCNYVDVDGKRYYINGVAYADNDQYGDIVYRANAYTGEFDELQCYRITWELTEEYKEYSRLHEEYVKENDGDTNSEWVGYIEDESNCCDWDNPICIEAIG